MMLERPTRTTLWLGLPYPLLPLAFDWLQVQCFGPTGNNTTIPGCCSQLLCKGPLVSSSLSFCSPQLRVPHPVSPLGAELPSQLWEHLFIPTAAPWGQLSLVRLRLSLAAGDEGLLCPLQAGSGLLKYQLFLCP